MEAKSMNGWRASLAWAEDCEAETFRDLVPLVGERAIDLALSDDSLLPSLVALMDSGGTDKNALAVLKKAASVNMTLAYFPVDLIGNALATSMTGAKAMINKVFGPGTSEIEVAFISHFEATPPCSYGRLAL